MSDRKTHCCVLLPCSPDEKWAIPQNCLGEIVTVPDAGDQPPQEISWRGRQVPVLDLDQQGQLPWRESSNSSGLVAVILGLRDEGCEYWAVALRGKGLALKELAETAVEDCPDAVLERAVGAFRLDGEVYQVPDLLKLQRGITADWLSA
jgi:hypothetical protein